MNDDPNDYLKLLLTSLEDDYCSKLGPDISKKLKPDFVVLKLHQTCEVSPELYYKLFSCVSSFV